MYYDDLSVDIFSPRGACDTPDDGCVVVDIDECLEQGGIFLGYHESCEDPCDADLDGSGAVDYADMLDILRDWGPCP